MHSSLKKIAQTSSWLVLLTTVGVGCAAADASDGTAAAEEPTETQSSAVTIPGYSGFCRIDTTTQLLTGGCTGQNHRSPATCAGGASNPSCPVGATPLNVGTTSCSVTGYPGAQRITSSVDLGRGCSGV